MIDNKILDGQLSLLDLLEMNTFKPLEALALCGTGFVNGMNRVREYFKTENSITNKAKFLKSEYGIGGFGSPRKKPCYIHSMETFGHNVNGISFEYYDENMNDIKATCTWEELAKVITEMLNNGKYHKENNNDL